GRSRPDRRHSRFDAEDIQYTRQIVGEHMQRISVATFGGVFIKVRFAAAAMQTELHTLPTVSLDRSSACVTSFGAPNKDKQLHLLGAEGSVTFGALPTLSRRSGCAGRDPRNSGPPGSCRWGRVCPRQHGCPVV